MHSIDHTFAQFSRKIITQGNSVNRAMKDTISMMKINFSSLDNIMELINVDIGSKTMSLAELLLYMTQSRGVMNLESVRAKC